MMILKPLEDALRDNDVIRSVIVASGINQDGKTPGITMPNGDAQGMSNLPRLYLYQDNEVNLVRIPYEIRVQECFYQCQRHRLH